MSKLVLFNECNGNAERRRNSKATKKQFASSSFTVPINIPSDDEYLRFTLDLDCILGHLPFEAFKDTLVKSVFVEIDNSPSKVFSEAFRIKSDYTCDTSENECLEISKLAHVKLGTSNADFGLLNIFLVLREKSYDDMELKTIVYNEIKKNIQKNIDFIPSGQYASFEKFYDSESGLEYEEFKCHLSSEDFIFLIGKLMEGLFKDSNPVIYIETFGNKNRTISSNLDFEMMKKNLKSCFNDKIFKYIHIDCCISSSYGFETVTLPNEHFFKSVKLKPNYRPLFSDTILNFHFKALNKKTGNPVPTGIFNKVEKFNFYSNFKRIFQDINLDHFIFEISQAMMVNNCHGHCLFSNKNRLDDICTKFQKLSEKTLSGLAKGTCPYRTEIRCRYEDMELELTKLEKHLVKKNFIFYDSSSFFKILEINLINLTKLIISGGTASNCKDQNSFAFTILAEFILKDLYILGFYNSGILPNYYIKKILETIPASNNSIRVLGELKKNIFSIYNSLFLEDKIKLVNIQADLIFRSNNYRKKIYNKMIELSFLVDQKSCLISEEEFIKDLFTIYVIESTGDDTLDYQYLKVPVDSNCEQVNINLMLKKNFMQPDLKVKSRIHRVVFDLFKKKFNYNNLEAFTKISETMQSLGIHSMFASTIKKNHERVSLVFYPIQIDEIKTIEDKKNLKEKEILLNSFKFSCSKLKPLNFKTKTDDEIVRYLHASFRHRHDSSRISNILTDFSYGFYPAKTYSFIKMLTINLKNCLFTKFDKVYRNESKALKKNKEFFRDIIRQVKEWSPDKFSRRDRLEYLKKHGIVLDDNQLKKYDMLIANDIEIWWESKVYEEINSMSPQDIFLEAILKNSVYDQFSDFLKEVSIEPIVVEIPKSTFLPIQDNEVSYKFLDTPNDEVEVSSSEESLTITRDSKYDICKSTTLRTIDKPMSLKSPVITVKRFKPVGRIKHFVGKKRILNEFKDPIVKFIKPFVIDSVSDALIPPELKETVDLIIENQSNESFKKSEDNLTIVSKKIYENACDLDLLSEYESDNKSELSTFELQTDILDFSKYFLDSKSSFSFVEFENLFEKIEKYTDKVKHDESCLIIFKIYREVFGSDQFINKLNERFINGEIKDKNLIISKISRIYYILKYIIYNKLSDFKIDISAVDLANDHKLFPKSFKKLRVYKKRINSEFDNSNNQRILFLARDRDDATESFYKNYVLPSALDSNDDIQVITEQSNKIESSKISEKRSITSNEKDNMLVISDDSSDSLDIQKISNVFLEKSYENIFINLDSKKDTTFMNNNNHIDRNIENVKSGFKNQNDALETSDNNEKSDPSLRSGLYLKLRTALFLKYRYRKFISSVARCQGFNIKTRPGVSDYNSTINQMIDDDLISKLKVKNGSAYKFNLPSSDSKNFLSYEKFKFILRENILSKKVEKLSVNEITEIISTERNYNITDVADYLNDMVTDDYIKVLHENDISYYYFK